ncbi:MAG: ankyrin repeat domain-containing protein [Planctomycetales bacterium]|nr:ankyrin repeat domain-containing protein [Planctomycetales bacterium]
MLIEAIAALDITQVQKALAEGADPNAKTSNGVSALSLAINRAASSERPRLDLIEALLVAGADPNCGGEDGESPPVFAALELLRQRPLYFDAVLGLLNRYGGDLQKRDARGLSALEHLRATIEFWKSQRTMPRTRIQEKRKGDFVVQMITSEADAVAPPLLPRAKYLLEQLANVSDRLSGSPNRAPPSEEQLQQEQVEYLAELAAAAARQQERHNAVADLDRRWRQAIADERRSVREYLLNQPVQITLHSASTDHWQDTRLRDSISQAFADYGFKSAGNYEIPELMGHRLCGLTHSALGLVVVVHEAELKELENVEHWCELIRINVDGFLATCSTRHLPDVEWQLQPPRHRRFWNYSGNLELMLHELKRQGWLEHEFVPVCPSTFVEHYVDYYYRSLQMDLELTEQDEERQA